MINFSSSASGDISMFDGPARELLRMAGRMESDRGAIGADEVAGALHSLRAALSALPTADTSAPPSKTDDDGEPQEPEVGLQQRAYPLIDLLERAASKHVPVLWEHR